MKTTSARRVKRIHYQSKAVFVTLTSLLTSLAEDGVGLLDFAGSKVMIDLSSYPLTPPSFIRLTFKDLDLYPLDL